MDPLDNLQHQQPPPPQEQNPFWQTSLRYGLYFGLSSVGLSLLMYLFDYNPLEGGVTGSFWIFLISMSLTAVFMVLAVQHHRDKEMGGYIGFGKAFQISVVMAMGGSFISGAWEYLMNTVIDPTRMERMKETFAENFGSFIPEDQMDEALAKFDQGMNVGDVVMGALVQGLILGILVGLAVAAFTKRDRTYM